MPYLFLFLIEKYGQLSARRFKAKECNLFFDEITVHPGTRKKKWDKSPIMSVERTLREVSRRTESFAGIGCVLRPSIAAGITNVHLMIRF